MTDVGTAGSRRSARVWSDPTWAVACGIVGTIGAIWLTAKGMVTFNDSATYLSVAEHIDAGKGITAAAPYTNSQLSVPAQIAAQARFPMSGWPPGYPLVLAGVMRFGLTALEAARVVAVAGGALLGSATFLFARRVLRLPVVVSLVVVGVVLVGPNVADVDLGPMAGRSVVSAEALFVPLIVTVVLVGVVALRNPTIPWVIATMVLIACATLIRATGPIYGIALLGAVLVSSRGGSTNGRRRRLVVAALFVGSGVVTALGWGVVNRWVWGTSPGVRQFGWYGASGVVSIAVKVIAGWFGVPWAAPVIVQLAVVIVAVVVPLVVVSVPSLCRRWWRRSREVLGVAACGIAVVSTVGVILATCVFLDRTLLPDARHLAPVQPFAYLLGAGVFLRWWDRHRNIATDGGGSPSDLVVPTLLVLGAGVLCTVGSLRVLPSQRPQVTGPVHGTAGMEALADLGDGVLIVTNAPDHLWLATGRTSLVLPPERYFTTMRTNPNFDADLEVIARLADDEPLLVVTSDAIPYPTDAATTRLGSSAGFTRVATCGEGLVLWGRPESAVARAASRVCPERG